MTPVVVTATTSSRALLLCGNGAFRSFNPLTAKSSLSLPQLRKPRLTSCFCENPLIPKEKNVRSRPLSSCYASRRKPTLLSASSAEEGDDNTRRVFRIALWVAEATYIFWLFLLPYAPGDPVWAISSDTINSLVGLSLNFFFILPFINFVEVEPWSNKATLAFGIRVVGVHVMEAPVLHPMSEGLFNFVIGWTVMFAPLLLTDCKRNRYKGSLDVLWGMQMFLTNTFLIPYMAIRLNDADDDSIQSERSQLGSVMTNGAPLVGLIGGAGCLLSIWWALYGRMDANFGGIGERWEFLVNYLGSERLAYAFIWDICLYMIFQPWLIGENLQNVQESKVVVVKYLRYVPVVGLIAYLLCLDRDVV
ncbi:Retrovirus-related Pol polyprotein from transposon TNT 1-94 [Senna tora]|uniref:Retrovirus-related Pol polyprotein from transposon TNT 1-94 n=1 Tax=Senna tora TaxID=362788 RepID=A0A834TW94_9FABA|nr:Retrovirus-related Pol polyprotein from transposon TNT 1-94 [Senna tora]